jgi:hypothetical protein
LFPVNPSYFRERRDSKHLPAPFRTFSHPLPFIAKFGRKWYYKENRRKEAEI